MKSQHRSRLSALAVSAVLAAGAARAESGPAIELAFGHRVGDRFAISLSTDTHTAIDTRIARGNRIREDVTLRYRATVEVLAVDSHGMPVRERHEGVALEYTRPDGNGSLFKDDATFEVVHQDDGSVAMFLFGARVEPRIEAIVGDLLAHRIESSVGRLLDPGRPVAVDDRWELDAARVRSFLAARGLHGVDLDGAATAQLRGGDGQPLRLHYAIPIQSFGLPELPDASRVTRTRGSLEGDLELASAPGHRPVAHASALQLRMGGRVAIAGDRRPARFVLTRSQSVDQRTDTVRDQLASMH
jgi:hypothetical protein